MSHSPSRTSTELPRSYAYFSAPFAVLNGVRIGVLSDAHGNLEAYTVARRALERAGVDTVHFLGDAVGYLPGSSVIEALVASDTSCVRGNHEAMLLGLAPDGDRDDAYRLGATRTQMGVELLDAVRDWPTSRRLDLPSGPVLLVHGSPDDPTFGYVYPDTPLEPFVGSEALAATTVFMGNTHRPLVRRCGSTTFVNVGSCGLPRDDGALGAACVFDSRSREVRILRFDITAATRDALVRCGPVHPSVLRTFRRRADHYTGDLVDA